MSHTGQKIQNDNSYAADADLRGKERLVVTMEGVSADGRVALADAVTDEPFGVLLQGANTGDTVRVCGVGDRVEVIYGGAVTRGLHLMIDAADPGKVVNHDGSAAWSIGIATATGVDGDINTMVFNPSQPNA